MSQLKECIWSEDVEEDYWNTSCNNTFKSYLIPDAAGMIYCPFCGGRLVVRMLPSKDDGNDDW